MNKIYDEFMKLIEKEDKEGALRFALEKLENKELDIVGLYNQVLTPALNSMEANEDNKVLIWREHVRSSIIRTIIENCYLYVVKERKENYQFNINKKVAVVCPSEEYHEIGARMVADYFTLLGYDVMFVGSNTPTDEFVGAMEAVDISYIALSVTNYYNIVNTQRTIEKIRETSSKVMIIVGGAAFNNNKDVYKEIGADMQLQSFEDMFKLAEGDAK